MSGGKKKLFFVLSTMLPEERKKIKKWKLAGEKRRKKGRAKFETARFSRGFRFFETMRVLVPIASSASLRRFRSGRNVLRLRDLCRKIIPELWRIIIRVREIKNFAGAESRNSLRRHRYFLCAVWIKYLHVKFLKNWVLLMFCTKNEYIYFLILYELFYFYR